MCTLTVQVGSEQYPKTTACCEAAIVTVRWLGFHRIWQGSGEVFDSVDLFLPDVQFGTQVSSISFAVLSRLHDMSGNALCICE